MKVGFIRVSTEDQNTIRQEILMKQLGVERVYIEIASGKSRTGRPQLEAMMDFVREGDVVIIIPWEFQNEKADVVWRYTGPQVDWLQRKGFLKGSS